MAEEPLFRYHRVGFTFSVYRNRIDVVDKSGMFGMLGAGKNETILLRSVTDVTIEGAARKLKITTSDGRKREFILGPKGKEARETILSLL